ncbi:MBL fold metallo-hydrolase [uncultured Croceitalea sp.]|uniref:MBL fold metallo-hydrolase n=1 Tax=uncultured Croceitalea sp. TaxID=1798908 RepID=UPI003305F744
MRYKITPFLCLLAIGCFGQRKSVQKPDVELMVLGTVQDAGSPHIGCQKVCCAELFEHPDNKRKVVSLGLVDYETQQTFLFEATPDMPAQLKMLKRFSEVPNEIPNGIFLTHAHIGHYTGLMYLGKEAMGAKETKVYAMPKMKKFLETNGPWSQLVALNNISITELNHAQNFQLTKNLSIVPFTVPHRDEFSETVGFEIIGPQRSLLFIPDIDKWSKWQTAIEDKLQKVDFAFLDATFFDNSEIDNRNISEIPHPFVVESIKLFDDMPAHEKSKIHFIHFNHTNPLLNIESQQAQKVLEKGYQIAMIGQVIGL